MTARAFPQQLAVALVALIAGHAAAAAAVDMAATVTGAVDEPAASVTVATALGSVSAGLAGSTFTAANVPLAFGPNTITVTAVDQAGNTASVGLTVHVAKRFAVQGTVADDSAVTVTVNGVPGTVAGGQFSAVVPLKLGLNAVTATAKDAAGNSSQSTTVEVVTVRQPISHP